MGIQKCFNPNLSEADLQHRLDILRGRKIPNEALDKREQMASTNPRSGLVWRQESGKVKPNIK